MNVINALDSIQRIGEYIENSGTSFLTLRRRFQRIDLKTLDSICFLKKGRVSIYRVENDIVTLSLKSPAILGLAQMRNEFKSHYMRCDADCEMWVINTVDAIDLFNRYGLWMDAFDLLTDHIQKYFIRENLVSHRNIRNIVIEHVRYIWSLPEEERIKISVYRFILARNHVSRSSVHNILKDLIASGAVQLDRGRILSLNLLNIS